jgi:hypothetical protein
MQNFNLPKQLTNHKLDILILLPGSHKTIFTMIELQSIPACKAKSIHPKVSFRSSRTCNRRNIRELAAKSSPINRTKSFAEEIPSDIYLRFDYSSTDNKNDITEDPNLPFRLNLSMRPKKFLTKDEETSLGSLREEVGFSIQETKEKIHDDSDDDEEIAALLTPKPCHVFMLSPPPIRRNKGCNLIDLPPIISSELYLPNDF